MRIKVDEDLPRAVVRLMRDRGYEADSVVDEGMGGWEDRALWETVQREGRFLVTADKGFADTRQFPPGKHAGVLLLRPREDGIRPVVELLERVLSEHDFKVLQKTLTVISPHGIRIRKGTG